MKEMGVQSKIYSTWFNPKPGLLADVALAAALASKSLRQGADALVFHQGQAAAALFRKARTICYFHQLKYDDLSGGGISYSLYRAFLLAIERQLVQVVCNSNYAASRVRALMPEAYVEVVYPGIRMKTNVSRQVSAERFSFYHSRLHPRKNQMFLLKVFAQLPCELVLSGGTWDWKFRKYQSEVVRRASQLGNVKLLTDASDASYRALLSSCVLFCFPAMLETFGMILLEAMAFNKPIVALRSGASAEVLGGCGLLCNHSVEDWKSAVTRVISEPDLQRSLASNSATRAKQFSWERTAKDLTNIIQSQ